MSRPLLALVVVALAAAGCGGSDGAAPRTSASLSDPAALDGCHTPAGARTVRWTVSGQAVQALTLPAAAGTAGTAGTAIIASNESDQNLCGWLPGASVFRTYGTVWLYDYAISDTGVDDVRAVAAKALAGGAKRIVLLGASQGAKASLVAAAQQPARVAAVVALSPEATLSDGTPVIESVRRSRVRTLIVTATRDPYQATPASRSFAAAQPKVVSLTLVPGSRHGTALLTGAGSAPAVSAIRRFLDRR